MRGRSKISSPDLSSDQSPLELVPRSAWSTGLVQPGLGWAGAGGGQGEVGKGRWAKGGDSLVLQPGDAQQSPGGAAGVLQGLSEDPQALGFPHVLLLPSNLGSCEVHLAPSHSLLKTTYAYGALPFLSQCF